MLQRRPATPRRSARWSSLLARPTTQVFPLKAGTDAVSGFTLQHALAPYVKAGLTPAQTLQVATRNGARYSKVLDSLGRFTPVKRADVILVDGDPTKNIADIRKVTTGIKGDVVYYPAEIHDELGIKRFAESVWVCGKTFFSRVAGIKVGVENPVVGDGQGAEHKRAARTIVTYIS